jgi:Cu2+-exporting ATPase
VCEAIYNAGLEGFYQRTPDDILLAPPPELPKELALFDLDEVQEEFVDDLGESRDINLLVEGIHCAACVWLIESTLHRMPGVEEARVNLSGRRLHLRWNNSRLKLSKILTSLGTIGYSAVPFDPEAAEGSLNRENRKLLYRMAFAAFAMMNQLWISVSLYSGADAGEYRDLFHWAGFAIATPTVLYAGYPFFKGAWAGLRNLYLGMDVPIAIGLTISYLYSLYVTASGTTTGQVYWDTVVNFLFVILVGRYLEAISKRQAVASTQRLLDLQPKGATVLRNGKEEIVPMRAVKLGEIVLIKPGDKVPVDGTIIDGNSAIDEAMLSGESELQRKGVGDKVAAGTINGHGILQVEVEGLLKDTALGRIIRLVEEAQASKAPIQCVADKVVPWFVAITISLALLTFFWWQQTDFEVALMAATAVLIITCPCAFGLATPMSIAVASGLGAKNGILVKTGAVLESLSSIRHFVFDKTGTLTEGRMKVISIQMVDATWQRGGEQMPETMRQLLAELLAIERFSEHPTAAAIVACAEDLEVSSHGLEASGFHNSPGYGIAAEVSGRQILVGNPGWMERRKVIREPSFEPAAEKLNELGISALCCAVDGKEVALIAVTDSIREGAAKMVADLRDSGIRLTMLSGDRRSTAEAIAARLGGMEVIAEVLPEDKDRVIAELQTNQHRVAMVGDGVNDAPALVRSDVGIAMGSGTDVSIASADIILMSSELHKVKLALGLSQRTLRTIRQNIGISITYNVIMVPLAMAALVTPLIAAISMPISSLLVIGNAARIRTLFKGQEG